MKKNLSAYAPLFGGLALVVLGAGLGWVTFSSWGEARAAAEELLQRKLGSVLVQPGGLEKLNQDIAALQKSRAELEKELQALVEPGEAAWGVGQPWSVDPGQWKDRLIEANDRIRKESGPAGPGGHIRLTPDFYLGFEEYRQKSPSADQVSALARQLAVSLRLWDHLLAARKEVAEPFPTICGIQAWKIPGVSAEVAATGAGVTAASPSPPAPGAAPLRETYQIALECSPEVLLDLVRRVASDSWMLIPMQLRIENEQASFPKRAEFEKLFAGTLGPSGATAPTEKGAAPSGKPPLLLILAGKEKLKVSLSIDFVGWPPPSPPATAKPKEGS